MLEIKFQRVPASRRDNTMESARQTRRIRRKIAVLSTAVLGAMTISVTAAAPVGADDPGADGFTTWKNARYGKFLEVRRGGTGNGNQVWIWAWNGGDHQLWISHWATDRSVAFENFNSGRCAEANGWKWNVLVDQWDCAYKGQGNMRWGELSNGSFWALENHAHYQLARAFANNDVRLSDTWTELNQIFWS